jgi:predicted membrane protein
MNLDWDLHLNQQLPLNLKIDSGAATARLDLHDLQVGDLDLNTGASTTEITLPQNAGNTKVRISTGASTVKVIIPPEVAASIRVKTGISTLSVAERFVRQGGNSYQSSDYNTAANRVELSIDSGVGTIDII